MSLGSLAPSWRGRLWIALGCVAIILVAVNIIAAQFPAARIDLTAEQLYTLSRGTRSTLARIDEPITLRFYFSTRLGDTIPAYGVYAQRVRELLEQYVAEAQGKLRLDVLNPEPFSDAEDRAVAAGLQGVPLNAQGEQVYLGLAGTNSTDDQQVIPFFAPERERFLEYDLTRLIHTLAFPKRAIVGLISGLSLEEQTGNETPARPARPLAFLEQLKQLDDVETLSPQLGAIPAGTDVLLLIHPQHLPAQTLFAIDQYVLRGGKVVAFVDPLSERQSRGGQPAAPSSSDLPQLFKAWGVQLLPGVIAADRREARRVVLPSPGSSGGEGQAMDYIAWLNLRGSDLNHDDVITANLRQIAMATAGILQPLPGATTKFDPLVTTSTEAMKLPVDQVSTAVPDVAGLLSRFKSENTRFALAARVTGPVETAFPDGAPDGKAAAPAGAVIRKSVQPVNIVVVADTDMLDDRFWARSEDFYGQRVVVPAANNADFIANAVDALAGGADLIDLRSRGTSARPFDVVQQIQQAADDRYAAEQKALEQKLKETQAKLRDLTAAEQSGVASLSPEQARAVDQFRTDMLTVRRELRGVQAALRQDIQRLKTILEFFNIALIPIIVAATAIVLGSFRLRRWRAATRRRSEAAQASAAPAGAH